MILFVMVCSLLLLALLELLSRRDDLRHLHVEFSLDSKLCEPGEEIVLRYTVHNTSRFPVLSAGLALQLDPELRVCEDEDWQQRFARRDMLGTRVEQHFYLLPWHRQGPHRLQQARRV